MTETIEEGKGTELEEVKEEEMTRRVIYPRFYICVNEEGTGYTGEIHLPGVERDSITLRMNENYLVIKGKTERVDYVRSFGFGCPVDPATAKSRYREGLLTFDVEFKEPELRTVDIDVE
ncbi:MAG: putative Hsp20/alpha crystallin family protein [Promethearchaeota archaeon]|nr:MAG: putative Hsp20/alpha crystallin family protein [Candidatus Lokiarchaeota archaeon]